MGLIVRGAARTFGHHIVADTAVGYGAKLHGVKDPEELGKRCMTGYDPEFPKKAKKGDIIVAGRNFACGHLHPQFNLSLKGFGISAIVAESFSRRFFRDGLNEGIPLLECEGALEKIKAGHELEIDFREGRISNITSGQTITTSPLPDLLIDMAEAGGLVPYLKSIVESAGNPCL